MISNLFKIREIFENCFNVEFDFKYNAINECFSIILLIEVFKNIF